MCYWGSGISVSNTLLQSQPSSCTPPAKEEAVAISHDKHSNSETSVPAPSTEPNPRKNWRDEEEQVLPNNNIPLVFFSLLLTTFLVSIASCCPAIVWLKLWLHQAALDETM